MLSTYSLGLVAALAIGDAMAQTPTPSTGPSQTSTSSAEARTITINVGRESHAFNPKETTANVGDIIKFNFFPGGHGVARANFESPCVPYEYASEKPGFWSGFFHPQAILNPPPSYEVRVNDTEPIFYYCAAQYSCTDWQMIGVINPNATQTFDLQLAAAKKAEYQLVPGEPFPTESARPKPTETNSPSSGSNTEGQTSSGSGGGGGLSAGAIAGIAIGGVAVLVLAAALLYLCGRRGGFDKAYRKSALPFANIPAQPQMAEGTYPVSANPKSPGQTTLSAFPAHDPYHNGSPFFGQSPSPAGYHPVSPNVQPGYLAHQHTGYSDVHSQTYHSAHASPQPQYQMAFEAPATAPAPVELSAAEIPPNPAQSPPPQYSQNSKA